MKMRKDALGLFWRDEPKPRAKKAKERRTPPDPVWLRDDYYPHLEEALSTGFNLMDDQRLCWHAAQGTLLEFDTEIYPNYTLVGFRTFDENREYIVMEKIPGVCDIDYEKLRWIMNNFVTVGFNNAAFDNPVVEMILAGLDTYQLHEAVGMMIVGRLSPWLVMRHFKINRKAIGLYPKCIDLMNVSPRSGSLKKYAGRCGIRQMQDLPFDPNRSLDANQVAILRWYWANDLNSNEILHAHPVMQERIALREKMGHKYGVDLRTKSDAQIAEAVFISEMQRRTGQRPEKIDLDEYRGTSFHFEPPAFINFQTPYMNQIFRQVVNASMYINFDARLECPGMEGLQIKINNTVYTMGIGGLHSNEKSRYYVSRDGWKLKDHDVTSYYPQLILNSGKFPKALGSVFVVVYQTIKDERVAAKRAGDKVVNESLKIVINGSFGKFGDPYSVLYAPHMLIQTTVTGQLSILMLIERLELAGIQVVSANTDGLVTYSHDSQQATMDAIIEQWQRDTTLELEHTDYAALFSRDVNNYFAVKEGGKFKGKGMYATSSLELDPKFEICAEAVMEFCSNGIPIEQTVRACHDVAKFVKIVSVNGGAVQGSEYLGKTVRFYKSTEDLPEMLVAKTGGIVPTSTGCRNAQLLPEGLPGDLDIEWYIDEAYRQLPLVGVMGYQRAA